MSATATSILLTGAGEVLNLLGFGSATQWAIYASGTTNAAITPDTFAIIDQRSDTRVSDYPLEAGAFDSYNKVQVPTEIRLMLVFGGITPIGDALAVLDVMRKTTALFDIATPESLFPNYTLTRYDYKRSSDSGVSMLKVDCTFQEIRQSQPPSYTSSGKTTSDSPSAASPENLGTVHSGDTVSVDFNGPAEPQPIQ